MSEFKVGDKVKIVIEGRLDYLDDSGLKINGKFYDTGEYSHVEKLSSEQPTLTLEPGKEYITNNNKRLLVHWVGDEYAFGVLIVNDHKTPVHWWLSDKHNIVGPWNPKPVVDWSLHSKWTKAVAMNKNGIWHWFEVRPVLTSADTWNVFKGYLSGIIPPEYAPKNADGTPWVGPWEDSLCIKTEE